MIDRKPMLYYSFSLLIGCYSSYEFLNKSYVWIALPAFLLIILFFTQDTKYVFVALIFLIAGFINYYNYFNKAIDYKEDIRIENVNQYNLEGTVKGRKVVVYGSIKNIKAGDIIAVEGLYTYKPQYEKGIVGEFQIKKCIEIKRNLLSQIYGFKEGLYVKYGEYLGKNQAGEIMAAAFGDVSHISNDEKQDMNKLGIIHVISVSGMHMALVFKICEGFLGVYGGIILSLLYGLFTGFSGSTLRAWVMIVVLKMSKKIYRNYDALSSISLAAMVLILLYPYYVLDIGCILSFLAVLGINTYYKRLRKFFYFLPGKLDEYIALTLSAEIFTFPACATIFNSVSLSMLQGNILIVPIYSAVVVLGNISMLFFFSNTLFKIACFPLKFVMLALNGGKEILLSLCSNFIYFSYVDAIVFMIIYTSYILIKSGKSVYKYLPAMTIIIYIFNYYTFYPRIEYVKVGNVNGIILRHGFNSVLYAYKQIPDNIDFIEKKFNVLKVENIDKDILINGFSSHINVEIEKGSGKVFIIKDDRKIYLEFIEKSRFMKRPGEYGIMYVAYEKSYNHYASLISMEIRDERLLKLSEG